MIEKELQMMKPGLKLVKDEVIKPVTHAKEKKKSSSVNEVPLTPTHIQAALPYGHVASWLWDFFKKGDQQDPKERIPQLGKYYQKI